MKIAKHGGGHTHHFTCKKSQGSSVKIINNMVAHDSSFCGKIYDFLHGCAKSGAFENPAPIANAITASLGRLPKAYPLGTGTLGTEWVPEAVFSENLPG